MVLHTMKEASGRRSMQSKSSKTLTNLSLPLEERKLRSAYRQSAYTDNIPVHLNHSASQSFNKRNAVQMM